METSGRCFDKDFGVKNSVSIDTMKPEIMIRAVEMGVDLINDVSGFRSKEALDFLKAMKKLGLAFVLCTCRKPTNYAGQSSVR